jgi:hypothetical protein
MSVRVLLIFFHVPTRWDPVLEKTIKGSFIHSFIHSQVNNKQHKYEEKKKSPKKYFKKKYLFASQPPPIRSTFGFIIKKAKPRPACFIWYTEPNGANVFYFLSSLPLPPITSAVFGSYLSSLFS